MIDFIARIVTCFIPIKSTRRFLRTKIKTAIFGRDILENAKSIGKNFICNGFSYCTENTIIKDFVVFNGVKIVGKANVEIGNFCQFGEDVLIVNQNHNYDEGSVISYDEVNILKDVIIEDFVWVGSRATILPGTKIGEGAIIQGGAVVHGEIPPYAIAGGNPAKVFKYRDVEHFKELKEKEMFLQYK